MVVLLLFLCIACILLDNLTTKNGQEHSQNIICDVPLISAALKYPTDIKRESPPSRHPANPASSVSLFKTHLHEGTKMIPYLAQNPPLPSSASISEQDTISVLSSVPMP